jgi:hypothetical protein
MDENDTAGKDFLHELYRQTGGNMDLQVSMYDVGAALGYEKNDAGSLAEEMIYQGLIELRTLSGGVSLCREGLQLLGLSGSGGPTPQEPLLSREPVATTEDRQLIDELLAAIKTALPGQSLSYQQLEEVVIDLKCIEIQMLSSCPKTAIIRELLRSLQQRLAKTGPQELSERLSRQL